MALKRRNHTWEPKAKPRPIVRKRIMIGMEVRTTVDPGVLGEAVRLAMEKAGIEVIDLSAQEKPVIPDKVKRR